MEAMEQRQPALSDPIRARVAWARYRKMMRWMGLVAVIAVALSLLYLRAGGGVMTIPMVIATAAGVGGMVMLATSLMLLAFLSAGSGHDEEAGAVFEEER